MMSDMSELRVTAGDLVRQFGKWQDRAATRPVFITHHGRDRLVLQSTGSYAALNARSAPGEAVRPAEDALIDQLGEGFVAFDAELRVAALNPAAAGLLRLPRAAAIGRRLFEDAAMRRSLLHAQLDRSLRSGAFGLFEAPSPAYPGRWLAGRTFPHRDGVAALLHDRTEAMLDRDCMAEGEACMAALAAHGGIGRAWLSPRGTFVRAEPALVGMVGLAAETLVGARLVDVLPLARRRPATEALEQVLAGGAALAIASELLRADATLLPIRLALAPLRDDRGHSGAVVVVTAEE